MIGTYAVINRVNNRPNLVNGYYVTETIKWDPDNNGGYVPNGEYYVRLPDFNECAAQGNIDGDPSYGLHAVINGNLKCVNLPAIDDKYDPSTGAFTRPGSDQVIWGANITLL